MLSDKLRIQFIAIVAIQYLPLIHGLIIGKFARIISTCRLT